MSSLKMWLHFLLFSKPNIDRSQQAVSAIIIQNSAAENIPERTKGPKTRAARLLMLVTTQILKLNYSSFPTNYLEEC
jgi:hypothetical protein